MKGKIRYGSVVFGFAALWAKLMEEMIDTGLRLEDIVQKTGDQAEVEVFEVGRHITSFEFLGAVSILSQEWKHGEQLQLWWKNFTK